MFKGFRWWWQQFGLEPACPHCNPGVECSFWASGPWDLTASAWFDCELSGANPVFGMCALTESGVLVQGGFPHCRGRSSSLVLVTVPPTFPFSQQEQEEEAQLCLSSGPLLSQAWPSPEQQGSNLAAQLTSFEAPSKKKKSD